MAIRVGMISLGCPKNQVDAELMLAKLADEPEFEITNDPEGADIVVVNTCGFIEDAKKEAIEHILEMADLKAAGKLKSIVVSGCLAERYRDQVAEEFPEVDAVLGIGCNGQIVDVCKEAAKGIQTTRFAEKGEMPMDGARVLTTPRHWAYLKVSDGCSNCCTYCAIPLIRGPFRSRKMEQILDEAKALVADGVKELVLIAQDTTRYGEDLYGRLMLPELLNRLCELDVKWIRIMYCYPDRVTEELLETIAKQEKICNYIDIPLQHADGAVLKSMNRRGNRKTLTALMEAIREKIPGVSLRTTMICGFPTETETAFTELSEFVNEIGFDRLGCFAYSEEDGTPAAAFDGQLEEAVRRRRAELIMQQQSRISERSNANRIGKTFEVLVEGYDYDRLCYFGRTYMDAPEIDGGVYFYADRELQIGAFVSVLVHEVEEYDLIGRLIPNEHAE